MNRTFSYLNLSIKNESKDVAEIDIDGEIGWINEEGEWNTKVAIKNKLKELEKIEAKKIIVNISSLGGFVDDGLAIHDVLAMHGAEIETRVTGMTASAATIIAQAGNKRTMSSNSLYLVHHGIGLTIGNIYDHEASINDLKAVDDRILDIYAKRSKKSKKSFSELMAKNSGWGVWLSAKEALEHGLVDSTFEPADIGKEKSKNFKNSYDSALFSQLGIPEPPNSQTQMIFDEETIKNLVTEEMARQKNSQPVKVEPKSTPNEKSYQLYKLLEQETELLINL